MLHRRVWNWYYELREIGYDQQFCWIYLLPSVFIQMVRIFFNHIFFRRTSFCLFLLVCELYLFEMKMHFDMFVMYVVYANILSCMLQDIFVIMFCCRFYFIFLDISNRIFSQENDSILKNCFPYSSSYKHKRKTGEIKMETFVA